MHALRRLRDANRVTRKETDMTAKIYKELTSQRVAIWFSCGVASTVAAKLALEKYPDAPVLYCPIAEENPDNLRFADDVARILGKPITYVTNPAWPCCSARNVWETRRAMSFPHGAPCTDELKRKPRQRWEADNGYPTPVMGFTLEEKHRADRFLLTEKHAIFPLIERRYTREMCFREVASWGIAVPEIYRLGFPNGNCVGCVKATSPSYWNLVRKHFPDVFSDRAKQSRELGVRLVRVKNERIYLDQLDPDAVGAPLKSMQAECGLFCEEQTP